MSKSQQIAQVLTSGPGSVSGFSANSVIYANTSGYLANTSNLTYDGTSFITSKNLTFTGTGNRILGDFSNATATNRVMFQTSTANSTTTIGMMPSGTGVSTNFVMYSSSDPTNSSRIRLNSSTTENQIHSDQIGTGTYVPMTFHTNGSERMRIKTDGNVGIGTNAPSQKLDVVGNIFLSGQGTGDQVIRIGSGRTANGYSYIDLQGDATYYDGLRIIRNNTGPNTSSAISHRGLGTFSVLTIDGAPLVFGTSSAERARFDTSGKLLVGLTGDLGLGSNLQIAGSAPQISVRNTTAAAGKFWRIGPDGSTSAIVIYNQDGTGVWMGDGSTSWNTNSDERLKTDLIPILDGLAKVNSLRAVTGRYKTDEEGKSRSFLIAQDVQKVLPEAISEKDEYLGISYTDTIPLLVAAIKDLKQIVDAQAAEIAALKSKVG